MQELLGEKSCYDISFARKIHRAGLIKEISNYACICAAAGQNIDTSLGIGRAGGLDPNRVSKGSELSKQCLGSAEG